MIVIKSAKARKAIQRLFPFIVIPLVVLAGALLLDAGQYPLIILAVTVLSLTLFIAGFEKKKTGTRRLILVSVMTALSVTGRFIPLFKPVTALTVLTAVYISGEAGFLVGAMSAVISNFYFGQGPWTPFQMFAWGVTGLIAGYLAEPLKRNKVLLALYGALSGILYSLIMDIWTVLWYNSGFEPVIYMTALISAIPYTVSYAVSNAVFLWFMAKPFGDKLTRVRLKYGV